MIDNETLLAYSLDGLEPVEKDAVKAKLADDTAAQANLGKIEQILKPFAVDRDEPVPPFDLTAATLAKLDSFPTEPRAIGGYQTNRYLELALAATVGLIGFGLVAGVVTRLRDDAKTLACQNNMRLISNGLHAYADHHGGKFPQIGIDAPNAGDFPKVMNGKGHWPAEAKLNCASTEPVGYSYSLGHRAKNGMLVGPARGESAVPVLGDFPNAREGIAGVASPHARGQNVLFADGAVRFLTKPKVGDDNIYLNDEGEQKAGLHPLDHVLGDPDDSP